MDCPEHGGTAPFVMVVQRGDEQRYQLLRKLFQSQRVDVVIDRRTGDRRAGRLAGGNGNGGAHGLNDAKMTDAERRAGERRGSLPDTWVNLGFFVARRHVKAST